MIKSVSDSQDEILKSIITLYCPDGFDLDPTYSKGIFYKSVPPPKWKSDIAPQFPDVMECDCRKLPFDDEELGSLVFDPPFVAAIPTGKGKRGIIRDRFGYYRNIQNEMWSFYSDSLKEFSRILKPNGRLVVKCQDVVDSGKQYLSHVQVINSALLLGLYPKDIFILIAHSRLMSPNMAVQQHARKFHCYFLVFLKQNCPVKYAGISEVKDN